MTVNEESFIEELRDFLKFQEVEIVPVEEEGEISYCFKGEGIFLDIDDVVEEL